MTFQDIVSPTEDILAEAAAGRMFILMDDEDRENEGDLVIPGQMATAEAVNFMARHGRGLICLSLTQERVRALNLPLMPQHNSTRHQTAFTVSIEAATGVTTGISAADRARTIAVAIDPASGPADLHSPGHVFPLAARPGGVLARAGHTEASVDIARLAGLNPSAVICEILNPDGSMARRDDLVDYARRHGLKIGLISDLIAYRRRTERLVSRQFEEFIDLPAGGRFRMAIYANQVERQHYIALTKGDVASGGPVLVRMHASNVFDDVLRVNKSGCADELQSALQEIDRVGRGVVVLFDEPVSRSLAEQALQRDGGGDKLRDYGIGAQILQDLGVREMVLMTNTPRAILGLHAHGLKVVETRPIVPIPICEFAAVEAFFADGALHRGASLSGRGGERLNFPLAAIGWARK